MNELLVLLLSLLPSPTSRARIVEVLSPTRSLDARTVQEAATVVGETLLQHCAPMRDSLVREMMRLAGRGPAESAHALRMAFEIGELMKLDIANHQLRRMRSYLVMTSIAFTRRPFERLDGTAIREGFPKTLAALRRKPTQEDIIKLVLDFAQNAESPFADSHLSKLPETLHQDLLRLSDLNAVFADLLLLYVSLLLAGQLDSADYSIIESLKEEIPVIAGLHPINRTAGIPQAPSRTGVSRFANTAWRDEVLPAIGVQIAARTGKDVELATNVLDANTRLTSFFFSLVRRRLVNSIKVATLRHLEHERAREATGRHWWTPPLSCPSSPVVGEASAECRRHACDVASLEQIVQPPFTAATNGDGQQEDMVHETLRKNGLLALAEEIDIIAERVARLVSFHWAVYHDLYDRMFDGDEC